MTNYTKSTDFSVKDVLLTGNPNKLVKGSEVDVEFSNIELADATNVKKTGTTGSAVMPVGTTAQRDASPAVGYTRVNTTSGTLEWWDGTIWTSANGGDAYDIEVTTATAGQTVITTASSFVVGSHTLMVYVNGLLVNKTSDYTETTTNSFTFVTGLTAGDEVVAQIWRTNIATSGDALTVTYTPAGTGAVATTVQTKLRESVSVKDFGAVGDGVTDDTAAIQAAIAAAQIAVNTDGKNRTVFAPAGIYQISGQLLFPYGVSFRGEGERSTTIRVASSFAELSTTGAIRIGAGTTSTFGVVLTDFLLECSSLAGSIGVYSSDIQSGGLVRVTVNNFVAYGVRIVGTGGTFGSVNGFGLEHVQCFKANTGGTSGFGVWLENGTFPAFLSTVQVYGNPANPLIGGYYCQNIPFVGLSLNTDGACSYGAILASTVPLVAINGMTLNGATTGIAVQCSGKVTISGLYTIGSTYSISDDGSGSNVVKSITDPVVPFFSRGGASPICLERVDTYSNVRMFQPASGEALTVAPTATSGTLIGTSSALANGAGASTGTLTNAPSAGNPNKWIKINDSGTIRYIPTW